MSTSRSQYARVGCKSSQAIILPPVLTSRQARTINGIEGLMWNPPLGNCLNRLRVLHYGRAWKHKTGAINMLPDPIVERFEPIVNEYIESKGYKIQKSSHFPPLVAHVKDEDAWTGKRDELCFKVAICVCVAGSASLPTKITCDKMMEVFRHYVKNPQDPLDRAMEFAIAFGCGKQKWPGFGTFGLARSQGSGAITGLWPGAISGLIRIVHFAVGTANRWLLNSPGPVGFPKRPDRDLIADAAIIAQRLHTPVNCRRIRRPDIVISCLDKSKIANIHTHPIDVSPGTKKVFTVRSSRKISLIIPSGRKHKADDEKSVVDSTKVIITAADMRTTIKVTTPDGIRFPWISRFNTARLTGVKTLDIWECSCGTSRCVDRHRLDSWDPSDIVRANGGQQPLTLIAFVASAVNGPALPLTSGAFVQGMYFPVLAEGF